MFFYREAMACSSTAMSAVEEVRVGLCGSVANNFGQPFGHVSIRSFL